MTDPYVDTIIILVYMYTPMAYKDILYSRAIVQDILYLL